MYLYVNLFIFMFEQNLQKTLFLKKWVKSISISLCLNKTFKKPCFWKN